MYPLLERPRFSGAFFLTSPPARRAEAMSDSAGVPGGFPGAPLHFIYYSRLKDRRLDQLMRDIKKHLSERVLLSTGLRQQESKKRMGYNKPFSKEKGKARVWANPLFYANKVELYEARDDAKLPENLVSACLHRSGE